MQNIGNLTIIALVILNIVVWLVFPPVYDGDPNFLRQYAGEVIGSNNIVLMACSLFLATRPKWAEKYFGGLDKMYHDTPAHGDRRPAADLCACVDRAHFDDGLAAWELSGSHRFCGYR